MNIRYKELKIDGNVYNKRIDIDKILIENKLSWLIDAEVENLRLEILKDTLVVNAGIIYNCVFEYGVIRDCDVRNILFKNGVIYNGVFKNFVIEQGIIFDGTFVNGDIKFADIRGGYFMENVNILSKTEDIKKDKIQPEVSGVKLEKMVTRYDKFVNEKKTTDVTEQKEKQIFDNVKDLLDDFKEYILKNDNIDKSIIKEEVKSLNDELGKRIVYHLNIDKFINNISHGNKEKVEKYFNDYYKSLPERIKSYLSERTK